MRAQWTHLRILRLSARILYPLSLVTLPGTNKGIKVQVR
ncbi:hypothetical protein SAMN05216337_101576 [Bradyrhizobium brasilense]|uniref:Uncharacterized protein n=1 Tax=Bradyrhizobium brasilense TaxID=1419277 RepID=A0A1G6XKX7_9BRAD|nr:hypothetical protein SAMN05216337_101576 [Bradyrhizobium brasilense]SDG71845.1 hypothetical protein SAMN05216338_1002200 [Bradyrhizobium sp. Rc2d]